MRMLSKDHEEYIKCLNDAKYFLKTYCTITSKVEMIEREEIKGKEFDEIKHIFVKYYMMVKKEYYENIIYKIERLIHNDGEVVYVIHFNGNEYSGNKCAIDRDDNYLCLVRKEKLNKINGKLSNLIKLYKC